MPSCRIVKLPSAAGTSTQRWVSSPWAGRVTAANPSAAVAGVEEPAVAALPDRADGADRGDDPTLGVVELAGPGDDGEVLGAVVGVEEPTAAALTDREGVRPDRLEPPALGVVLLRRSGHGGEVEAVDLVGVEQAVRAELADGDVAVARGQDDPALRGRRVPGSA